MFENFFYQSHSKNNLLRASDHRQSPVPRELINQMSCHIDYSSLFMEQNQLLLHTVKSAYLLTFKLYCVTEVDSLLLCLSQPRNFEEYKAHIALPQNQKDLCYFIASTSCLACCPQLVEEKPSTWTVKPRTWSSHNQASGLPRTSKRNLQKFPSESSKSSNGIKLNFQWIQ